MDKQSNGKNIQPINKWIADADGNAGCCDVGLLKIGYPRITGSIDDCRPATITGPQAHLPPQHRLRSTIIHKTKTALAFASNQRKGRQQRASWKPL